ncbi:MAG: hypothetical protein WCG47_21710, partial [Dermatophilaceae bacterium]
LELQWWRLHRAHQHAASVTTEQLIQSLVELSSYLYAIDPSEAFPAARWRVDAMDLSDRWVEAGCRRDDQLLAAERQALVDSTLHCWQRCPGNHAQDLKPVEGRGASQPHDCSQSEAGKACAPLVPSRRLHRL